MTLEEVLQKLKGRTIVNVEAAKLEWQEKYNWLTAFDSVRIILDDGTVLDSQGEPVEVIFSKPGDKVPNIGVYLDNQENS